MAILKGHNLYGTLAMISPLFATASVAVILRLGAIQLRERAWLEVKRIRRAARLGFGAGES